MGSVTGGVRGHNVHMSEKDVAIVLSGGGVNGVLLQLGFLKRLLSSPLWPRVGCIYGTSAGALTGTMAALDRLDDPDLTPVAVALELQVWGTVVHLPVAVLSGPHNDWTEFVGPDARGVLEDALQALDRRHGAPLRAEVARLDDAFERKTSNNPFADPTLPWWARRWWH